MDAADPNFQKLVNHLDGLLFWKMCLTSLADMLILLKNKGRVFHRGKRIPSDAKFSPQTNQLLWNKPTYEERNSRDDTRKHVEILHSAQMSQRKEGFV